MDKVLVGLVLWLKLDEARVDVVALLRLQNGIGIGCNEAGGFEVVEDEAETERVGVVTDMMVGQTSDVVLRVFGQRARAAVEWFSDGGQETAVGSLGVTA